MKKGEASVINGLIVDICGVPKKRLQDPYSYTGYFSMLNKWLKTYSPEYIHFVLTRVLAWKIKSGKKINIAYIETALRGSENFFVNFVDNYVIVTRDILEANGVSDIPMYMLSSDERRKLYATTIPDESKKNELIEKMGIGIGSK